MMLNGVTLTIVGMIVVFIFLALLVLVMNVLFLLVKRLFPDALKEKPGEKKERPAAAQPVGAPVASQPGVSVSRDLGPEIAAAIAAVKAQIVARG